MNDRVSQHIVLCEDDAHAMLVSAYMRLCNIDERERKIINTSESGRGGIGAVLSLFPEQLKTVVGSGKRGPGRS